MKNRQVVNFIVTIFLLLNMGSNVSFAQGNSRTSGSYSGRSTNIKSSESNRASAPKISGGYSGASKRSVPSAKSGSKNTYMQEAYKKNISTSNYSTYKQTLNSAQKSIHDTSMKTNYNVQNKMNFESAMNTKSQRISDFSTRSIRVSANSIMFVSPFSYGYAFIGPWDLWFLMRASDLFWYHHWAQIYPYRDYFDQVKFAEMEARVQNLELQNVQRDPNYLEPGVEPDLQFSREYEDQNADKIYYCKENVGGWSKMIWSTVIIAIIVVLLLVAFTLSSVQSKNRFINDKNISTKHDDNNSDGSIY